MPEDIIKPNQPSPSDKPDQEEENLPLDTEETTLPESPDNTADSSETSLKEPEVTSTSVADPLDTPVGTPSSAPQPQQPASLSGSSSSQPQFNEPQKHGPKLWLILVLIVLVIGASVAAALYITKSSDKQTATPTSAKKDIQNLRLALPDGDMSKFYPSGNTASSVQLNSQVFEGLVRYDQQTKIVPLLATKWSNPDTSTWVFKLRDDVKFHNGSPMTAEDVKYSIDYAVAHQEDENTTLYIASSIKGAEVTGDHEVKITTNGPDPILLNRLAYLYIMDDQTPVGSADGGTGPYTVKSGTTPSANDIELVAWDKYHDGHVYTRSLSIDIVPAANDMIAGINKSTFDLVGSLEEDEIARVKNYEKIEGQNFSVGFIGLNTLKEGSPLSSKEGRQAVAYALDIPKILKAGGLTGTPTNQLIPPKIPGYNPTVKDRSYDPEKAKQLLAKIPNANMPLKLSYGGGEDNLKHMTEITNELKAVGLNVTLDEQPDIDSLVSMAFAGGTDMFYVVYDSPTLDGQDYFSSILQGNGIYNNQEINSNIDKSAATFEPAERLSLLKTISKEVSEDLPVIPVYTPVDLYALRKPYNIRIDIPSAQTGVYFWKTYQK